MLVALLAVEFCDELASGVLPASTPEVQAAFGLTAGLAAGLILVGFQALSVFVEPLLLLRASRGPRRPFLLAGLFGMAACCLLGAASTGWAVLLLSVLLYGPASGLGVHLAQAALMDERAGERERAMARWCLWGLLGDAAAFALLPVLAWAGLGWRSAMLVCAAAWVLLSSAFHRAPVHEAASAPDEAKPSLRQALGEALRNRRLLAWTVGGLLCALLDEIVVAFGALHLSTRLGLGPGARSLAFGALLAGQIVGVALVERLLVTIRPLDLLRVSTAMGAVAYVAWVYAPGLASCAVLAFVVGALAAPSYPIVEAQAYASLPGRSGTVAAVGSLLGPFQAALPLALAWVADGAGLTAAMLALVMQPVGVFAISSLVGPRKVAWWPVNHHRGSANDVRAVSSPQRH